MANSKLIGWQGGGRTGTSGSSKFLIKQSREPYGSIPKTNYAFQLWLVDEGYLERLVNNAIDSVILYQQLHDQFFGKCGGGDGTLLFGIQVVRKDRASLPTQSSVKTRVTWGFLRFRETVEVTETIFVDVDNTDTVTVSDYYVTQDSPASILTGYSIFGGRWVSAYRWSEGGVYNSDGDRVTYWRDLRHTERTIDDNGTLTLKFSQNLIGTLSITIKHQFDDYVLTNPPHDLGIGLGNSTNFDIYDEQKVYASTVLGFGGGDYINMPLEIPESAADCIPYAQITDPETGQIITVIEGSETHTGYDTDGDGTLDGGAEVDECTCWMCGGEGQLPDCTNSATVDCTCPNCQGTGILPACQEDESSETNNSYYTYNNYGGDSGDDGTDKPYTLKLKKHICTNQVVDWDLNKNV